MTKPKPEKLPYYSDEGYLIIPMSHPKREEKQKVEFT
jgi:hypothetical protein